MAVALDALNPVAQRALLQDVYNKGDIVSMLHFLPKEKHASLNVWTRIKVKFRKLDKDEVRALVSIGKLSEADIKTHWNDIITILTKSLSNCKDKRHSIVRDQIKEILKHLTPQMLDQVVKELVNADIKCKKNQSVKTVLKLLSLKQVESLMKYKHQDVESLEKVIKKMVPVIPPKSLSAIEKAMKSEMTHTLSNLFSFIPNIINTFLSAFRLFDLGKEPENAWEASGMLDVYFKLFAIPTYIVVLVQASIGVTWQVWALSGTIILLGLLLVYAYIRWLKPCPERISHCDNITLEAKLGNQQDVVGRDKEINFLLEHYAKHTGKKTRHIILVGPTDVGKSQIINGVAQRIISGNVPQKMKNKKIFVISTGRLAQKGFSGFADQLDMIFQRVDKYDKEVILFFEEIHVALKTAGLADFLKTYLEKGNIQCVATTTLKEYEKYFSKDEAFSRRFQKMEVQEISENHTKKVLYNALKDHKDVLIDEEAVNAAYNLTEQNGVKGCQPSKSQNLLLGAASEVRSQQVNSKTQYELQELQAKLEQLQASCTQTSMSLHPFDPKTKALYVEINKTQEQIKKLEKTAKEQQEKLKYARRLLKQRHIIREKIYDVVREYNSEKKEESDLKTFVVNLEYMLPLLQSAIKDAEKALGDEIPIRVNKEIVEKKFNEVHKKPEAKVA